MHKISTAHSSNVDNGWMKFSLASGASTYNDVMILKENGNVGIGDSAPADKLSVNGTVKGVNLKASSVLNCSNGVITTATGQLACNSSAFLTSAGSITNATYASMVNGTYTGGGGLQPPSYIPSGKVRFNMMASVPGTSGYQDWLMMDTYTGSDVPYVTMIGVSKTAGNPVGYLAVGAKGGSTWTSTPIITGSNIGAQTVSTSTHAKNADEATALAANPANCAAGQYARGIAADGSAEDCTTAPSGADNLGDHIARQNIQLNEEKDMHWLSGDGQDEGLAVSSTGSVILSSLVGSGNRMVMTAANGTISAGGTPNTGSGTTNYITKWTGTNTLGNSLIVDNGTNVGIGTTSPSQKFQVVGKTVFGPSTAADASSLFSFNGIEPRLNYGATLNLNDTSPIAVGIGSRILMGSTYDASGATTGGVALGAYKESATSGTYGYALTLSTRANGANVTERMRITANGNVGIGTSTPYSGQKVDINGSLRASALVIDNVTVSSYNEGLRINGDAGTWRGIYLGGTTGSIAGSNQFMWSLARNNANDLVIMHNTGTILKIASSTNQLFINNKEVCDDGNNCGFVLDTTATTSFQLLAFNGSSAVDSNVTISGSTPTSRTYTFGDGAGSKINVGTVDPIYTIGGKHYATYMAGMTGVKEETSGVLNLTKQSAGLFMAKLDFDDDPEGSDTWLFGRTTNLINNKEAFDQAACLLTANFAGQTWYEKDWQEKTISIFAKPDNGQRDNVEVSYRLTAPRFDYLKWTNSSNDKVEGFNLDKLLK